MARTIWKTGISAIRRHLGYWPMVPCWKDRIISNFTTINIRPNYIISYGDWVIITFIIYMMNICSFWKVNPIWWKWIPIIGFICTITHPNHSECRISLNQIVWMLIWSKYCHRLLPLMYSISASPQLLSFCSNSIWVNKIIPICNIIPTGITVKVCFVFINIY